MEWRQDWLRRYAAAGKKDHIEIEEKNERNVFGVDRIFLMPFSRFASAGTSPEKGQEL